MTKKKPVYRRITTGFPGEVYQEILEALKGMPCKTASGAVITLVREALEAREAKKRFNAACDCCYEDITITVIDTTSSFLPASLNQG